MPRVGCCSAGGKARVVTDVGLVQNLPRMWAGSCPGCGFSVEPAPNVSGVFPPNVVVCTCWTGLPRMWVFGPKPYPECVVIPRKKEMRRDL